MSDVVATSFAFPGCEQMDSAYSAMLVADDGCVYTALCTHNGRDAARLVRFEPPTGAASVVADVGIASGAPATGTIPQGKVHTRLGQGRDGLIYFATHPTFPAGPPPPNAPAGHFMAHNPRLGICHSVGRAPDGEAVITAALDPERLVIYGLSNPSGRFLICTSETGTVRDLGPATNGQSPCRTIGIDDRGDAYFTREPGEIVRYSRGRDRLETLPPAVPHLDFPNEANMGVWRTILWDPVERLFYAVHARTSYLFEFEPRTASTRGIAPICAAAEIGDELSTFASLAFAQAPDRTLYYVAARGIFDYFNSKPLRGAAHLMSYAPGAVRPVDHGAIVDREGRRLWGSQNAAVSGIGEALYVLGAMETVDSDQTGAANVLPVLAKGASRQASYQLRLLRIDLRALDG